MQTLIQQVPPQVWPAFTALVADRRDVPTFAEEPRHLSYLIAQYQDTSPEACRCRADDAEASLNPRIALYGEYVSPHTGLSALLGQALLTAVGDKESAAGGVAPPWPL